MGYRKGEEVLSMRLGKEQAAGFVEDLEAAANGAEEIKADSSGRISLIPAPEPVTVAG
jgi:hypothetical protein